MKKSKHLEKVLKAKVCRWALVLPLRTVFTQFWLSVCHNAFPDMETAKEFNANSIAFNSFHVELIYD